MYVFRGFAVSLAIFALLYAALSGLVVAAPRGRVSRRRKNIIPQFVALFTAPLRVSQ